MKKYLSLLVIPSLLFLISNKGITQVYSSPSTTWGISTTISKAANDAYGKETSNLMYVNSDITGGATYGMNYGFGGNIYAKIGLGALVGNRLIINFGYSKFQNTITHNSEDPTATTNAETNFNFITSYVGYEYNLAPHSNIKPYLGGGLLLAFISGSFKPNSSETEYSLATSTRIGLKLNAGYEFTLNKNRTIGLDVMGSFTWYNLMLRNNKTNTSSEFNLNDGDGEHGPTYVRIISTISLNIGLNFYPGVTYYKTKK